MRLILTFSLLFVLTITFAQLPTTNVFVVDFTQVDENNYNVENPIFVTSDNSNGYNNQPHFIGKRLYISSARGSEVTDVYAYDFEKEIVIQVTNTAKSEFSPTLMPDGAHFSSVCIEADGSTQRLWKYPVNMIGFPELVMDKVYNVAYHTWVSSSKVGLFIVGEPNSLQLVDLNTRENKKLATNIGRSLHAMGNYLYYLQKSKNSSWSIKRYDTLNLDASTIAIALQGQEDFIVLPDGTLIMGADSKLYKFKPTKDLDWIEIVDLKPIGVNKISRLAFDSGKLAIVSE